MTKTRTRTRNGSAATAVWRNRISGQGEVDPKTLIPNPANWRGHPREQQRGLAAALSEVGWVAQVMVNTTTGHIVDGHLRVELAIARNEPSVPVTYVELSEEEERLVLATLDPLAAMATAEKDALAALLAELSPTDDALAALLAELGEQNGIRRPMLGDPDEVPPVPDAADVYVRPGDLFVLGDHRLLCGDATDPDAVARLLDGATPTLLATDPPYGVSLDPTWRDGVYNDLGPAETPYMRRMDGHRNTTLSGDTRIDWSEAFALVLPSGRLRLARRCPRRGSGGGPPADRLRDRQPGHLGQGPLRHEPGLVSLGTRALLGDPAAGCPEPLHG
ncbi:MAG TPA: ParB N-terminal domain-containing protein [Candidatus Limnocylindrales bacterium]|jgi:hypothetical protein